MTEADARASLFGGVTAATAGENPYANEATPATEPTTVDDGADSSRRIGGGVMDVDVADPEDAMRAELFAGNTAGADSSSRIRSRRRASSAPRPEAQLEDIMSDVMKKDEAFGIDIEDIDLAEITQDLERFEKDEFVQEALSEGVDLREYSRQIEADLKVLESASIGEYLEEAPHIARLHNEMKVVDTVLLEMQELLTGFQSHLGGISDEIRHLQERSLVGCCWCCAFLSPLLFSLVLLLLLLVLSLL